MKGLAQLGLLLLAVLLLVSGAGCSFGGANKTPKIVLGNNDSPNAPAKRRRRLRPPINSTQNLYEGSLWKGAASWGNLLRDHRARFRGDLLTVVDLQKIIKVPDVKPQIQAQAAQAQQQQQQGEAKVDEKDPILAFLKRQEKQRELVDKEQNEILRSINSVEVQVVRVLSNGNMVVRGVHPPIFRDRNRVKYIVSVSGIVRPSDVADGNNVNAIKLSKANYQIRRLVRRDTSLAGGSGGARPTRGLFDRLTNFISKPGSRSTAKPPAKK